MKLEDQKCWVAETVPGQRCPVSADEEVCSTAEAEENYPKIHDLKCKIKIYNQLKMYIYIYI